MNNKKKATKQLTAANEDLKKTLSVVRGQLTKTETKLGKANGKAERWKKEAAAQRTAASRSEARVEKLQKKLEGAAVALEPVQAPAITVPDKTWTVVQLRAEARARGLVGMAKKTKAQLLAALS